VGRATVAAYSRLQVDGKGRGVADVGEGPRNSRGAPAREGAGAAPARRASRRRRCGPRGTGVALPLA